MKKIYLLFTCNEFKERSGMRLAVATTYLRKIKSVIIKQIIAGDMEYKRNNGLPKANQCKLLRSDWREFGAQFVFDNIEYGYVEIVNDGEIQ